MNLTPDEEREFRAMAREEAQLVLRGWVLEQKTQAEIARTAREALDEAFRSKRDC